MKQAEIHGLSHDGRGIATIQNKTTFIAGALPSETVGYKIIKQHTHFDEAIVAAVIIPSAERMIPPCEHVASCGGCSLQHMAPDHQRQLKEKTLLDQLNHFGKLSPDILLPPLTAATMGYRRKARLGVEFNRKKHKVFVGFREKASRDLADIQSCLVLHPHLGTRLTALSELIFSLRCRESIPQIEFAMGDKEAALIFRHLKPLHPEDIQKLIAFGKNYDFNIHLQPNAPLMVHQIWPENATERLTYSLPDHGIEFLFHPLDFTQINYEMNLLMVKQALHLLDIQSNEKALDLFCGIGNFTLPMAKLAKHVTGVEGAKEMCDRATENAKHNHINNVDFFAANLQNPSPDSPWMKSHYDKLLLDPPRTGAKEIIDFIPRFHAKRIVYISCNPATLSRDAGILVHKHGYQLKQVGMMDMFPHTAHTEAIAVFDKN